MDKIQFIKKYWSHILCFILIVICSIAVTQCENKDSAIGLLVDSRDSAFNKAVYHETENGKLVGQVNTLELSTQELKKHGEKLGIDNESLTKEVGRLNRVVARWEGKVRADGEFTVVIKPDSTPKLDTEINLEIPDVTMDATMNLVSDGTFEYDNGYLSLQGDLDGDSVKVHYQYQTKFSLTAYRKPQGLFKEPQLVADIYFQDPNMKVGEFKGFVISNDKPKFFQKGVVKFVGGFVLGAGLVYAASR